MESFFERTDSFGIGRLRGAFAQMMMGGIGSIPDQHLSIHPRTGLFIGSNARLCGSGSLRMGYTIHKTPMPPISSRGALYIGKNASLVLKGNIQSGPGTRIHIHSDASLEMGHGTFILYDSAISAKHKISIGSDCAISWNVHIMDTDWHKIDYENRVIKPNHVSIGNHVWIGHGVSILKGVTVGDGCVVAAGSVVVHDLPARCLAAGNPAKPIKYDVSWEL